MADLVKKIDVILHQGTGGAHPLTHADLPWRGKAQRIIETLSRQSYERAQMSRSGHIYRKHQPYAVPELARKLVRALDRNDEHTAKALFLSYDGMKAIGGKRRHAGGDPDVVDVIFRAVKSGEDKGLVEAFFPAEPGTNEFDVSMYAHVGQHGSAATAYITQNTRPAKPSEYAALKRELESAPYHYKLRVVKRMTRKHFEERKAACQ